MTNPEQPQPPKPKPGKVKYPKQKTTPNPPPAKWEGLKTFADVDRDKPKYSDADLEALFEHLAGVQAEAFTELADREAPNSYRTYISARAKERLKKSGSQDAKG